MTNSLFPKRSDQNAKPNEETSTVKLAWPDDLSLVRLAGVQLLDFCCFTISRLVCCWVLVLFRLGDKSWFVCSLVWFVDKKRSFARTEQLLCVYEPQQSLGWNRFKPPPSNLLLTVPRRCFCYGLFSLSMFVRFLFVFDLLFNLFKAALWPSFGKELSPWLFTCAVFILVPP